MHGCGIPRRVKRLVLFSWCLLLVAACGSSLVAAPTPGDKGPQALPTLTTKVPPPVLAKVQATYMIELRKCAHTVIQKDKKAAGRYNIEFQVDAQGKTTALGIEGSSSVLTKCLEAKVNTWTFEPITDAENQPVSKILAIPVSFSAPRKLDPKADARMIQVINKQYMSGIHACHKIALSTDPKAVGRVKLRYLVNVDGTVTIANAMGIPNADLMACIRGKVLTWRLPPPRGADGKPTTKSVGITIVLKADGSTSKP